MASNRLGERRQSVRMIFKFEKSRSTKTSVGGTAITSRASELSKGSSEILDFQNSKLVFHRRWFYRESKAEYGAAQSTTIPIQCSWIFDPVVNSFIFLYDASVFEFRSLFWCSSSIFLYVSGAFSLNEIAKPFCFSKIKIVDEFPRQNFSLIFLPIRNLFTFFNRTLHFAFFLVGFNKKIKERAFFWTFFQLFLRFLKNYGLNFSE